VIEASAELLPRVHEKLNDIHKIISSNKIHQKQIKYRFGINAMQMYRNGIITVP
jgi:hypothetical protein